MNREMRRKLKKRNQNKTSNMSSPIFEFSPYESGGHYEVLDDNDLDNIRRKVGDKKYMEILKESSLIGRFFKHEENRNRGIIIGDYYHEKFREIGDNLFNEEKIRLTKCIGKLGDLIQLDVLESTDKDIKINNHKVLLHKILELQNTMDFADENIAKYLSIFKNDIVIKNYDDLNDADIYLTFRFEYDKVILISYQYDRLIKEFFPCYTMSIPLDYIDDICKDIDDSYFKSYIEKMNASDKGHIGNVSLNLPEEKDKNFIADGVDFEENQPDDIMVSDVYFRFMTELITKDPVLREDMEKYKLDMDTKQKFFQRSIRFSLINEMLGFILLFVYFSLLTKQNIENRNTIEITKNSDSNINESDSWRKKIRSKIKLNSDIIIYTNDNDLIEQFKTKHFKYSCSFSVRGHDRHYYDADGNLIKIVKVRPYTKGKGKFRPKTYETGKE